ncbi:MAG: DsbA family protein, partial [Rhodospirillales bacterium]|nr:DsbA family protein [Rhodospirillales bacterium]
LRVFGTVCIIALVGIGAATSAEEAESESVDKLLTLHSQGAVDAPVTIVEFSSLTCPHCASFHSNTLPKIKTAYINAGKVRYVYHDFPLDSLALAAAMLTRCVAEDRYFGFLDTLFANQSKWAHGGKPLEDLEKLSRFAGLSKPDFDACLANEELMQGLRTAAQEASEEYDINSTPSFLVNGEKVTGAVDFSTIKKHIDDALAAAEAANPPKGEDGAEDEAKGEAKGEAKK